MVIPPFYQNWDNTHCLQCCLRGVLEYFEPTSSWTWEELDNFTGKEPEKWTWPYIGWVNMSNRGYDVINISAAKIQDYLDLGIYEGLVKNRGKEAADIQRKMANLERVEDNIREYAQYIQAGKITRHERVPNLNEMQQMLTDGYLIMCSLNYRTLYHLEGYASHSVLIYHIDDTKVYFHDPEHAPETASPVNHEHFVAACTSPTEAQWLVTAYKKS